MKRFKQLFERTMKMRDIVRKHKRELQKAKKTGNLDLSKKAEDDLQSWVFDNEPSIGDDPDDFIEWLDDNLDDILRGRIRESVTEKYKGSLSDFKREFENEIEQLGFSPKVIKKISKKGKGFEVRVASYMKRPASFEKAASKIGATVTSFKKGGGVNIMVIN